MCRFSEASRAETRFDKAFSFAPRIFLHVSYFGADRTFVGAIRRKLECGDWL